VCAVCFVCVINNDYDVHTEVKIPVPESVSAPPTDVIVLTSEDFNTRVKTFPVLLVEFYAPYVRRDVLPLSLSFSPLLYTHIIYIFLVLFLSLCVCLFRVCVCVCVCVYVCARFI